MVCTQFHLEQKHQFFFRDTLIGRRPIQKLKDSWKQFPRTLWIQRWRESKHTRSRLWEKQGLNAACAQLIKSCKWMFSSLLYTSDEKDLMTEFSEIEQKSNFLFIFSWVAMIMQHGRQQLAKITNTVTYLVTCQVWGRQLQRFWRESKIKDR